MADEDNPEDPNAPEFLLRNLDIAVTDCFADSSHNSAARHASAQLVSAQIGFYVGCLLRGFEARVVPLPPNILLVGSGFIGSSVVELLMANGLSSFLHVFCRGDLQAQQWRRRGLKSSPSMARLMKDVGKADIVIVCAGLSGFSNTAKLVAPFVTPATAIITSSFGLQRKRVHASLQTLGVFRTYLEPHSLVKHVRHAAHAAGIDHSSFDDPALVTSENDGPGATVSGGGSPNGFGGTGGGGRAGGEYANDDDDASSFFDDASQESSILDSIKTYKSGDQFLYLSGTAAGSMANAADLLARRTPEMRHLVTVMENYFSLLGLRFASSRAQAMYAVLGYIEDTPAGMVSVQLSTANVGSSSLEQMMRARGLGESEDDDTVARDLYKEETKKLARAIACLTQARMSLEANVMVHFQRQLSKYIRVVDLPRLSDFVSQEERRSTRKTAVRRSQIVSGDGAAATTTSTLTATNSTGAAAVSNPNKPFEPVQPPPPQGHGPLNSMHPDKAILHIFALDTKHRSPLWERLDAENDGSSVASFGTHDTGAERDAGHLLDSLDEVSASFTIDRKALHRGGAGGGAGGGGQGDEHTTVDASILLAIELANAHKKKTGV